MESMTEREARRGVGWAQEGAVRSREEAPKAKEGIPGIRDRGGDPGKQGRDKAPA